MTIIVAWLLVLLFVSFCRDQVQGKGIYRAVARWPERRFLEWKNEIIGGTGYAQLPYEWYVVNKLEMLAMHMSRPGRNVQCMCQLRYLGYSYRSCCVYSSILF